MCHTVVVGCHPGKIGDLLWALPTLRFLTSESGAHLWIPENLAPRAQLEGLLALANAEAPLTVARWNGWIVQDTAPASPRVPDGAPDNIRSLGYREWPLAPLPLQVALDHDVDRLALQASLARPWLSFPDHGAAPIWIARYLGSTAEYLTYPAPLVVSFSDRYYELKLGLLYELATRIPLWRRPAPPIYLAAMPGSRWASAPLPAGVRHRTVSLPQLWYLIYRASVLLCDNSAPMVMAAATQTCQAVVVEPESARHHHIFWPGWNAPTNGPWDTDPNSPCAPCARWIRPVLGGDGRPTFDARHTHDALQDAWQRWQQLPH